MKQAEPILAQTLFGLLDGTRLRVQLSLAVCEKYLHHWGCWVIRAGRLQSVPRLRPIVHVGVSSAAVAGR